MNSLSLKTQRLLKPASPMTSRTQSSLTKGLMPALLAISILSLGATSVALAGGGNQGNSGVLPPQSNPYGKGYGAWGAEWWKWVYSIPAAKNPIQDTTGEFGGLNQSGPVWFLAGTFGATAERTLTIPSGKGIFFPTFNYFNDYPCPDSAFQPAPGQTLEAFLAAGAAAYIDQATALAVQVDGVELKNLFKYRAASHLVTFTADPSWVTLDPCVTGGPQSGVSDGYWVMLAPLSKGEHTIHISAAAGPGFNLDVTYHLTVLPADLGNHDIAPPSSEPYGKSYGEWSAQWWTWAMELPVNGPVPHPFVDSPAFDVTEGQHGNVWFLAAPFGTVHRTCAIPAGKALFVGLLNVESSDLEGLGATEAEQRASSKWQADHIHNVACSLDGDAVKHIDHYRVASPQFSFTAPDPWIFSPAPGGNGTSVSDGYFVLLNPLSKGSHTLHCTGNFHFSVAEGDPFDWDAAIDITYTLTVAPGH